MKIYAYLCSPTCTIYYIPNIHNIAYLHHNCPHTRNMSTFKCIIPQQVHLHKWLNPQPEHMTWLCVNLREVILRKHIIDSRICGLFYTFIKYWHIENCSESVAKDKSHRIFSRFPFLSEFPRKEWNEATIWKIWPHFFSLVLVSYGPKLNSPKITSLDCLSHLSICSARLCCDICHILFFLGKSWNFYHVQNIPSCFT